MPRPTADPGPDFASPRNPGLEAANEPGQGPDQLEIQSPNRSTQIRLQSQSLQAVSELAASLATVKLLSGLVQNVSTFDLSSFVGVALLLFTAGLLASFWPARRAACVDPVTALRE
jgi:hypothetical protein